LTVVVICIVISYHTCQRSSVRIAVKKDCIIHTNVFVLEANAPTLEFCPLLRSWPMSFLLPLCQPRQPDAPAWESLALPLLFGEPDDTASSPFLPLALLECRVCILRLQSGHVSSYHGSKIHGSFITCISVSAVS
jgi:hypothetical protein